VSQQERLTCWRGQRLGLVKIWKKSKVARSTHFLERSEAMTSQGIERRQAGKGHSLPEGGRGHNWSEHRKKANSNRYSLAGEGKFRTGQDREEKQVSNGHLLPGESRGQDWLDIERK